MIKIIKRTYFIFSGQNIICHWIYESVEDIINQIIKRSESKNTKEIIFNTDSKILILDQYSFINDTDNSEIIAYKCLYENRIFWALNNHFEDFC